jgi:hypothetical protein
MAVSPCSCRCCICEPFDPNERAACSCVLGRSLSDDKENELRTRRLLLCSGVTVCLQLTPGKPRTCRHCSCTSQSPRRWTTTTTLTLTTVLRHSQSVRAHPPVCRGTKLPMLPMTDKPNVWLSGLFSTPSLPFSVTHWQAQGTSGWGRTLLWYTPKQNIRA